MQSKVSLNLALCSCKFNCFTKYPLSFNQSMRSSLTLLQRVILVKDDSLKERSGGVKQTKSRIGINLHRLPGPLHMSWVPWKLVPGFCLVGFLKCFCFWKDLSVNQSILLKDSNMLCKRHSCNAQSSFQHTARAVKLHRASGC